MELVIVESPTKAKTLSQFLGKGYEVAASMGHVLDLPKNGLGVDVENNFKPTYVPTGKSKSTINTLQEKSKKADHIWLSTDPDREGEAIAWHVANVIGANSKLRRAVFHEITKEAVEEAFRNPRGLDINLVNSQQARRVLDRLVGYKLSPLLWKKIRYGLSAGRVQSVAVRLIVERERERESFVSAEYWTIDGEFRKAQGEQSFRAQLSEINGKKTAIGNKEESERVASSLKSCRYFVVGVEKSEKRKHPYAPFTTSTLQQTAGNRFGFTAARVMKAAQSLYEKGLITYMRTDSTNLASAAVSQIRSFIGREYGSSYLPDSPKVYKTKSRLAQEAHEAIRPTRVELRIKDSGLSGDEGKVYELIWTRTVTCQMKEALYEQTSVNLRGTKGDDSYDFRAGGSVLVFDGWLKVVGKAEEDPTRNLPELAEGENLDLLNLAPQQHFTEPPPRFTEASLIKELEERGIGRPSTYAPTVNTIINRGYVAREGRTLFPQTIGGVVSDLLVEHFPEIVDYGFTAQMEEDLDEIAQGKKGWVPLVRHFYTPFEKRIEEKEKEIKKEDVTTLESTDETCPECSRPLVVKLGKFGEFLSCTGFPDCKFAKPVSGDGVLGQREGETEEIGIDESQLGKCPQDGGDLLVKQGRFGKFVACANYPNCKFTKPYLEKIGLACPQCRQGDVVIKRSGRGKVFFGCSRYPDCKYASWAKPAEDSKKET